MTKKKSDNTFKNRHADREKDNPKSDYSFPNTKNNLKKYCSVEEILKEFVPLKK